MPPTQGLCVVVSGTVESGFSIIGPFPHPSYAYEWANAWEEDVTWEVQSLVAPESREVSPLYVSTQPKE